MKVLISGFAALAIAASLAMTSTPSRADDAASSYKTLCAKCHGDTGKGDGPSVAKLEKKPHDLTDCATMGKLSDDDMFKVIKEGGPAIGKSKEMNGFGDGMEDDEIKAMVAYVRTLCKK